MVKSPMAELIGAIKRGKYDRNLDLVLTKIGEAIAHRREVVSEEIIAGLAEGDEVLIKRSKYLKPRYAQGKLGKVNRIEGTVVWVTLDRPVVRRGRSHTAFGIPAWNIEKK